MAEAVQTPSGRQNRRFMLGSLSIGHGVAHLYDQGFPVFMPAIAASLGLSTFQVALTLGIRQLMSGLASLAGGVVVDQLRDDWGNILTICMIWSALSFLVIAASPNLGMLVLAVVMVAIPGSLWHLPAIAAISQRFPDRRAFALSIHSFGSSIGNSLAPLLAAALLTFLLWRNVLMLYAIPAFLVAIFVWWALRRMGEGGEADERETQPRSLEAQIRQGLQMFRNPAVAAIIVASTLRGVANSAMFEWTPLYLKTDANGGLELSYILTGVNMALLTGMGVVSSPILGHLSDRYGRKQVLLPGLALAAAFATLVVSAGDNIILLLLTMTGVGLFSFALHQIMLAAALDIMSRGTEGTTTGVLFGINGVLGLGFHFLFATIIEHLGGYGSLYYCVAVLTALSLALVAVTPFASHRPATE